MKETDIIERFKSVVRLGIRPGTDGERGAAAAAALRMVERYPFLIDTARLLGLKLPGPATRGFPWAERENEMKGKTKAKAAPGAAPAAAKTKPQAERTAKPKPASANGRPWRKPPTPAGYEWRQCYKPLCHCMRGGPWHGPYRYTKKWRDGASHSDYKGKQ